VYSVSAIAGATYTWIPGTGLTIASGQGTNTVTLSSSANGPSTIGLNINRNGCSFPAATRSITNIGVKPARPGAISGPTSTLPGEPENYSINPLPDVTGYKWYVPSGWTIRQGQGTTSLSVDIGNKGGDVAVSALNACGESSLSRLSITVGSGSHLRVYPNPANTYADVMVTAANDYLDVLVEENGTTEVTSSTARIAAEISAEYQINLYNSYNPVELPVSTTQEGKLQLDTSKLPNGIYYLQATRGTETISKQIVIQH